MSLAIRISSERKKMSQAFAIVINNQRPEISPLPTLTLQNRRLKLPLNLCQKELDIGQLNYSIVKKQICQAEDICNPHCY